MPTSNEFHSLPIGDITVDKSRQRKEFAEGKIEELADSLKRVGLLHPIVVTRANVLVAGERRLLSAKSLGWTTISVHYLDELDPFEAKAIELEENIKRVDLTWKESCLAAFEYHELRMKSDEDWNRTKTAAAIGLHRTYTGRLLQVAAGLNEGNARVAAAANFEAAYRVVRRDQERVVTTEIAQINVTHKTKEAGEKVDGPTVETLAGPDIELECADFIHRSRAWDGRKFNFLHCDFPYGVKYDSTTYSGSHTWPKYNDSKEVYYELLHTLVDTTERICFPSCHLMFWFSMNYYNDTIEALESAGWAVNPFPLIWFKDRGLIPDAKRGPRRVYETALMANLGDRKVIKSVPNVFYHKVEKQGHISTKPQMMLQHFFQMFVDDLTELFDPTCGSGMALAAGKVLGAKRIAGMDIEEEYIETTKMNIRKADRRSQQSGQE